MDRPAADRRTARAQAGHIEVEFLQQVEREWMHGAFGVAARRSRRPDGRDLRRRLRARRQRPRRRAAPAARNSRRVIHPPERMLG